MIGFLTFMTGLSRPSWGSKLLRRASTGVLAQVDGMADSYIDLRRREKAASLHGIRL
jgi:hypothetical protein